MTPPMLASFHAPIPWSQVARRTFKEIVDDNCLGLAAQLSFYFLLGLFPALLFFVALLAYLPIQGVSATLVEILGTIAPMELVDIIRRQMDAVMGDNHAGLLTVGFAGALWSSSAAMVAIIDALNRAFDVNEWRPWWKRRSLAIALTLALALFILVSLTFVVVGPDLAFSAAGWLQLSSVVPWVWSLLRWPLILCLVILGINLVYHFAPNRRGRWVWVTPGSILATVLWIASSFVFKFYLAGFADYAATYGAIASAIVAMLWFYVSGLAILIGAELNSVLEEARRTHGSQS